MLHYKGKFYAGDVTWSAYQPIFFLDKQPIKQCTEDEDWTKYNYTGISQKNKMNSDDDGGKWGYRNTVTRGVN